MQEKLKKDFDINLNFLNSNFDEFRPNDDIDIDLQIKETISEIKNIIKMPLDENISFDKNYQITNEIYLANFSFSRYSIYKELEENSEFFQEQEILKYLFDRNNIDHRNDHNHDFSEDSEKNPKYFIDEKYSEKNLFTVLPADSSQLKAILLASSGNSFVLQGPPGTGKSQTITNIIAQLIANGKSILFVSAKMAALDVVYEKLKDVKLNDFCLKLNISSSNGEGISKKDALKQLENAWSKGKNTNNFSLNEPDWDRHNNEIDKIKILLNEYKDELHYEHQNGLKLYDAIGYLSNNNDAQDIKNLEFDFESHTKEYRDELEAIVRKIQECVSDYSEIIQSNELKQINIENKKYNHAFQNKLEDDIDDAKNIVGKLENDFYDLISFFNLNSIYQNISNDGIEKLVSFIKNFYFGINFINLFSSKIKILLIKLKIKFSSLQNFEKNKITNLILESDFVKDFDCKKLQDKIFSIKKSKENLERNIEKLYQECFVKKNLSKNYSLEEIKNSIEFLDQNKDKIKDYFYWNEIRNQSIYQYKLEVLK